MRARIDQQQIALRRSNCLPCNALPVQPALPALLLHMLCPCYSSVLTLGPQSRVHPSLMGISTTSTLGASVK